jgi:TrmH family RNA methyltransferase
MKKYRHEWELCIVEGKRLCEEALSSHWTIEAAFISESFINNPFYSKLKKKFSDNKITPSILNYSDFKNLAETDNPQGVLFVMRIPSQSQSIDTLISQHKWFILLEGIRDPGNMGTIIRTADWFGIPLIISSSDSVDFFSPKVIRSSMGSIFRVDCIEIQNLNSIITILKEKQYSIIGTSPFASMNLENSVVKPPFVIVLGSEAEGISENLKSSLDTIVKINKYGESESLNVAVAAGIVIHHFSNLINHE